MSSDNIVINGHFRTQQITGVQRYAQEIVQEFNQQGNGYSFVEPPRSLRSDQMRQLWMQLVMPFKVPDGKLLWSPTNIGPIYYKNQVVTLHDISDQLYPEWFDLLYVQWRSFLLPRLLRNVKGIITVSRFSRQTIIDKYPFTADKVKVIYNGVQTEIFYPREQKAIDRVRKQFKLDRPYLVMVGSLAPRKNINGLLEAWSLLPEAVREDFHLVIIGGSSKTFSLKVDRESDPSVIFTGYVEDEVLPVLYSGAEVFVYPSLFEGFGLPVLEAMACRTPVITSDTTSLKELAGDKALLVDPHSPEAIRDAIERILDSPELRETYGKQGYEYARTFSWSRTAAETRAYLEEVNKF